jgi:predicted dehydrogenase
MNILILGDGPEELSWAIHLLDHPEHHLAAACPGFKSLPDIPGGNDLDTALALPNLDAVICGGDPALRAEGLRRAASTGMRALALHPPGPNADPYYQVALSRQETGAIVVPDLPMRRHPGFAMLDKALGDLPLGKTNYVVRYEATISSADGDLVGQVLPRVIDGVRALMGDIQAVTATGVPHGERPNQSLTVHLRGKEDLHGEIRLQRGPDEAAKLIVPTEDGSLTLEHDLGFNGASRLVRNSSRAGASTMELGLWDAKTSLLRALEEATTDEEPSPGLNDGTRAMEIAEAAARGLRKGRTIDLYYEEMSELGNFKSVMTSMGCGLLLMAIFLLFLSAALPWMGFEKGAYIGWLILPLLVGFMLFQLLRYNIGRPTNRAPASGSESEL